MRLGRALGAIGRTFIAAGVLILLFVAYQLWGTGLQEARSQGRLEDQFAASLDAASSAPSSSTSSSTPTTAGPTTTLRGTPATGPAPPPPPRGEAAARIRIPEIGVDKIVVEGVSLSNLKKGPGHYPETPMPGQPGNAAIAGHRTTYGAPFFELQKLGKGDEIRVTTLQGDFRYEVMDSIVVRPHQTEVLAPTDDNRLTLTTCNPRYSARERLVVWARLAGKAAPAPPPRSDVETTPEFEEDAAGLSGRRAARLPAIGWGIAVALVGLGVWLVARRRARKAKWAIYAAGTVPFLVVLFIFFENFSRLLPANF